MSSRRNGRDALAPSTFPFLAVLLCTMGSLVLILMLIVAQAQASAQSASRDHEQQVEEIEAQLELASESYQEQLTEGRIALEKQRLALQHLENHISELLAEMESLQRTAQLLEQETDEDDVAEKRKERISRLEAQLLEAKERLKQKLDKPDGDKPIFAVIPYDGPNGTHRRPIYLECTAEGVIIQPEGVLLSHDDLQPPYGPGNPLDAALRTIRTQFVPDNHAVTSTAYPLLIVRPSGIHSYTMARAAMSGWDDQFGYELIEESLELSFPDSHPGLIPKITQAVDLARKRQAALVMAMPRKYRHASGGDGFGSHVGGPPSSSLWEEAGRGSEVEGTASEGQGFESAGGVLSGAEQRGGFAMDSRESSAAGESSSGGEGAQMGFGPAEDETSSFGGSDRSSPSFGSNTVGGTFAGPADLAEYSPTATAHGAGGTGSEADGTSGNSLTDPRAGNSSTGTGQRSGSSAAGSAQPQPSTGNQIAMPFAAPGDSSSTSASAATSSANGGNQAAPREPPSGAATVSNASGAQAGSGQSAQPVAAKRGRDWAWSRGPVTQTPVVRTIRLQVLPEGWIVQGETRSKDVAIPYNGSPQSRAEQLAATIADRVESWGLALAGGYWKPILEVEVDPAVSWRFDQLRQLLEGSGLEVKLKPPMGP